MERPEREDPAARLIAKKHDEYVKLSRRFRLLYYVTRICAVIPAAMLPFLIGGNAILAKSLSIAIALATAVDVIFDPKTRWGNYSRATDRLAVAELKRRGEYESHKEGLDIIAEAEASSVGVNKDIDELLRRIDVNESRRISRQ